jgi:hypothetical protein
MFGKDIALDRCKSENGTNEVPARDEDIQTSSRLRDVLKIFKSTLAIIGSRLRRRKRKIGQGTPNSYSQSNSPPGSIADFDQEQNIPLEILRPEIDLKLAYPLVENREELDPKTLEVYNRRVREMAGRLKMAEQFGASAFSCGLAEEIVGTELRVRICLAKIYGEAIEEFNRPFEESHDRPRDNMRRTLETRPSYLSQRISKLEDADDTGTTRRGNRMRESQ